MDDAPAQVPGLRVHLPGVWDRGLHHITWWEHGGPTDLDNLVLTCTFHHRLMHEYGWAVKRGATGSITWFRPDGTRYSAGPAPPSEGLELQPAMSAVGS